MATKTFTVEIPDGAEVSMIHLHVGEALYSAARISPDADSPFFGGAWWYANRHDEDGCYGFPTDPKGMTSAQAILDAIARDIAHGKGVGALVTWVCELVEAGRDRDDERSARKYASQVAVACE